MSIGELTNLYRDDELVIQPAFQRLFRWDDEQKSQLIESILLGIPIPSIFVAQDDEGRWELVDGLQRVSTILQLQGLLDAKAFPPLVLRATKYLKSLEGLRWDSRGDRETSLSSAQRLDFKRAKIDVKIIRRESSIETKYDLFQRLNSFGSPLSAQEIRNAILVAVNSEFVNWLQTLAKSDAFVQSTRLTDRDVETKYDEDLVLRFLWLHDLDDVTSRALSGFQDKLENAALNMANSFHENREILEDTFTKTFTLLAESGGENIFRKWNDQMSRFQGGFLNTAYEVIGIGLGHKIARGLPYRDDLTQAAKDLWRQPDMTTRFATGKATDQRLAIMLPKGRELLQQLG